MTNTPQRDFITQHVRNMTQGYEDKTGLLPAIKEAFEAADLLIPYMTVKYMRIALWDNQGKTQEAC